MTTIFEVTLAGFALSLSPGPSMLYVMSRTVGQGRSAGLASAIGLALGGVLLALLTALGMSALIRNSALAMNVLTVAGAAYLVYLGVTQLVEARRFDPQSFHVHRVSEKSFGQILTQAVLVEALNPKTILFFVLFISRFLDPNAGNLFVQALIYGMLVPLTAIPSDLVVVYLGGKVSAVVRAAPQLQFNLSVLAGLILIGIGMSLFL